MGVGEGEIVLTVGELFAGIGGIGLGLERTGHFEVKWQVERDEYASKVLAKHWPDVFRYDDVCTFPPKEINEADLYVDVICGGFP
jgi:DNA (cytosine-5)-methyltransferase 1